MAAGIHIALYCFYLLLFLWWIYKSSFFETGISKKYLSGFFLLKVFAGITLTLIYTYYYTDPTRNDIYRYFKDSKIITDLLFKSPVLFLKIMSGIGSHDPDAFHYLVQTQDFDHPVTDFVTHNKLIIRINVLLNFFSFSSIWINTLFFNFFTFTGLVALYKAIKPYLPEFSTILFIPIFLLPSVVFWSSGLLKEGLLFGGIGWFFYWALADAENRVIKVWAGRVATFIFILCIKPVVAFCLLVSLAFLPAKRISSKRRWQVILSSTLIIILVMSVWMKEIANPICERVIDKRNEFIQLAIEQKTGSFLGGETVSANCTELITLLPSALINSILRPFVWGKGNLFQFLFAIENLIYLSFLLFLFFFFRMPKGDRGLLAMLFFSFAIFNYLIIGITVPIVGAIVHYRIIASPFLLLAILFSVDEKRIKKMLSFL